MRVSTNKDHPDYHPLAHLCSGVYLAGAQRANVVSADEEGRKATVIRLDDKGRPIVKAGELVHDEFFGDVRIECPAWLRTECEMGARAKRDVDGTVKPVVYGKAIVTGNLMDTGPATAAQVAAKLLKLYQAADRLK